MSASELSVMRGQAAIGPNLAHSVGSVNGVNCVRVAIVESRLPFGSDQDPGARRPVT
jgi:hypothetical protein